MPDKRVKSWILSKEFWMNYDGYDNLLRYRDDKPYEDLTLLTRGINNGMNITIINESLIQYRIHDNQIGEQNKKENKNKDVDIGFTSEPSKDKKRIGIFCICTGNYINYLSELIETTQQHFLTKYPKIYIISTDQTEKVKKICDKYKVKCLVKFIDKKGFPLDTLYRFKYLLYFDVEIELICDVIYYIDVDMKILDNVGDDILPSKDLPLIGTKHPGFAHTNNKNGSPETNEKSTAYILPTKYKECYIAGGFNGGITHYFLKMAKELNHMIDIDKSNDIIARWHDESHLNRYLLDNFDKFKILSTDYCYPENYHEEIPGTPKILALSKDHNKMRNHFTKYKIIVNIMGGLGNLLFQIFFAYTIALRYNLEICLIHNQKNTRESSYNYYLFDNILRVNEMVFENEMHEVKEVEKHYTDILSNIPMNKNIYLNGFFQSSKFFTRFFDRIKTKLNYFVLDIAKDIIKKYKKNNNKKIIGIHIRGTDYKEYKDYHTNLEKDYYTKCLEKIHNKEDYNIVLFTDDIPLASSKFNDCFTDSIINIKTKYISNDYKFLLDNSELDLFLLSLSDIIICANSTFSVWSSYFSDANEIYIPFNWFAEKGPKDFIIYELCINDKYIIVN